MKKLLTLACLVILGTLVLPSVAQASTPSLAKLAKTVAALQKKVSSLQTTTKRQALTIASLSGTLAAAQHEPV